MARPKASLNEALGGIGSKISSGAGLTLKDLPTILGEKMPELPRNAVGRIRLINGLKNRFGSGFRNISGIKQLIRDFDDDIDFDLKHEKMKRIRAKE